VAAPPQFKPPGEKERIAAIGPVDYLPAPFRRLLEPSGFEAIHAPGPLDWLAAHPEPGQTVGQFLRSHPNFPSAQHRTIYLQPLEHFPPDGPALPQLKAFTEAYFSMPVKVLPVLTRGMDKVTTRINSSTHQIQLFTQDILTLLQRSLPADAYCLLGITLRDLYPDPYWNFVFGEATFKERVGVYSFARYDPRFYGENAPDRMKIMLRRSCKVLAHETGHMFGIEHCIYFRCVMDGSNSLPEDDSQPMHLCPVDLRKLYESIRFDPVSRYAHLRDFCREAGFDDEAAWIEQQLRKVPAGT
jgi:archaemetzincin